MASIDPVRRPSTDSVLSISSALGRSRTWTEDVQKTWNLPVASTETFAERVARYTEYFSLTEDQLVHVYNGIAKELALGCRNHSAITRGTAKDLPSCSLRMLDSYVDTLPTGDEKGTFYALDFAGTSVRAVRAKLEGSRRITTAENRVNVRDEKAPYPKGLLDKHCGAMSLFNCLSKTVEDMMRRSGDIGKSKDVPLGFSIAFPCSLRGKQSATLIELTKAYETGRSTNDPIEGQDVVTLLDMTFWRNKVNAKVAAITNDAVANLISCAYEKPTRLPPCTVAFSIGVGLGAAYIEPNWNVYGYKGMVVDTELGGFDKDLPVTDVDLEVDFADQGNHGKQMFEKMIAGGYLGEICRRLAVKVFQDQAPALAWSRQALPTAAAALIVSDDSESLELTDRLLKGLWDWQTDRDLRSVLQRLFSLVFERSAGLAAAAIAAIAKRSGRLQPAMGGLTVAVEGSLHVSHPWYSDNVRKYLVQLLGASTASFVHLYINNDGAGKGAAVLACMYSSAASTSA